MTLKELLYNMTDETQVQVILEKQREESVGIVGSAKGIYESYSLNLGDHLVDIVYIEDNVLIVEIHKGEDQ